MGMKETVGLLIVLLIAILLLMGLAFLVFGQQPAPDGETLLQLARSLDRETFVQFARSL